MGEHRVRNARVESSNLSTSTSFIFNINYLSYFLRCQGRAKVDLPILGLHFRTEVEQSSTSLYPIDFLMDFEVPNRLTSTSISSAEESLRDVCSEWRNWCDPNGNVDRRGRHEASLGHDIGYFLCSVFCRST